MYIYIYVFTFEPFCTVSPLFLFYFVTVYFGEVVFLSKYVFSFVGTCYKKLKKKKRKKECKLKKHWVIRLHQ